MNKEQKRKASRLNDDGFSLIDGVIASGVTLALAVGVGFISYSSIQENQKKDAVRIAADTAYSEALSAITDFDKNTTATKAVENLNENYNKDTGKHILIENKGGEQKNSLCVTASMDKDKSGVYKYIAQAGNCGEDIESPTIPPPPAAIQDTFTTVNYKCDVDSTGKLPFTPSSTNNIDSKKAIIKGSDGSSYTVNMNGEVNFKAGVDYTVNNSNKYYTFSHSTSGIKDCVTSIDSFGKDSGVKNLWYVGGKNLVDVPSEIPTTVTSIQNVFHSATKIDDPDISSWDTSNVTSMGGAFQGASTFNQPLNNWKVEKVTGIAYLFKDASNFNQSLDTWNFNELKSLTYAFSGASKFNKSVNHWDTSRVTGFSGVFQSAIDFDQPLDNWKVNNAVSMSYMFNNAQSFNQPLDKWTVTNKLKNLHSAFFNAKVFDQNVNHWDTSNVTDFTTVFGQAYEFNQPLDNWKLNNAENMTGMFQDAWSFNKDISSWRFPKVTSLERLFDQAKMFNQSINDWETDNVTNLKKTFMRSYSFNQPLDNWKVGKVVDFSYMFEYAFNFNQNLDSWNFTTDPNDNITMERMFRGPNLFNNGDAHQASTKPLQWNTSRVVNMNSTFNGSLSSDRNIVDDVDDWRDRVNGYKSSSFNQPIGHWDTSSNTDLSYAFYKSSFKQPLNGWDTSNVTRMVRTFQGPGDSEHDGDGNSYYNQPLNNWKTSKVTDMFEMFRDAHRFNQPLNNWNTSNVTDMTRMFYNTEKFNQNISGWSVNKVNQYEDIFGFSAGKTSIMSESNKPAKFK